jgi:hypothetical protein
VARRDPRHRGNGRNSRLAAPLLLLLALIKLEWGKVRAAQPASALAGQDLTEAGAL